MKSAYRYHLRHAPGDLDLLVDTYTIYLGGRARVLFDSMLANRDLPVIFFVSDLRVLMS